jgi:hypothetical protein
MNSYLPCKYLVDDEVSKTPKTKTPKTNRKQTESRAKTFREFGALIASQGELWCV